MTFNETLTAALNDFMEHGFDTVHRLERWTELLRKSAAASLKSPAQMEKMLRQALGAIYIKLVDKGQIIKFHEGVERFTIERLKPKLHQELQKRIAASADLIKLNRETAINDTIQRFSGWASAMPEGGASKDTKKQQEKERVRKGLVQLPFEERRVLIDQGHKLTAAISNVIAVDGGAIAMEWHSHWRQPGYNYREDHKERDGKVYLIKDNWATAKGLVKPGPNGYYDDITKVAEEPFCRCNAVYIYSISVLPHYMLTDKGRAELKRVREKLEEMRAKKS